MMLEQLIKKEWSPDERKALWEDILRNDMVNVLYEGVSTFQPLLFDQWTRYTQHNETHNAADGSVVVQPMIQINLSDISSVALEYIESKLYDLKQSKSASSSSPAKIELPSLIASHPTQLKSSTLLPSLASAVGLSTPTTISTTPTLEGSSLPMFALPGADPAAATVKQERDSTFTLSGTPSAAEASRTALCGRSAGALSPLSPLQLPALSWEPAGSGNEHLSQGRIPLPSALSAVPLGRIGMMTLSKEPENSAAVSANVPGNVGSGRSEDNNCSGSGDGSCEDEEFEITLVVYDSKKRDDSAKPFECSYPGCGKRFSDRSNLMTHIRKHTQEKPFTCRVCGRGFSHKSTLRDHEHAHTGEQPYRCDRCGKCFSQKSNLQRHTKIHTGKMPYKCPLCSKTFNQSSNLKTHIHAKHHHNTSTTTNSTNGINANSALRKGSGDAGSEGNIVITSLRPASFAHSPASPFSAPPQQQQHQNTQIAVVSASSSSSLRSNGGGISSFVSLSPQKEADEFLQTLGIGLGINKSSFVGGDNGFLPPIMSSASPNLSSMSLTSSGSSIPSSSVNSPGSQSPILVTKPAFAPMSFLS